MGVILRSYRISFEILPKSEIKRYSIVNLLKIYRNPLRCRITHNIIYHHVVAVFDVCYIGGEPRSERKGIKGAV